MKLDSITTMEEARRETKMDCREMSPFLGEGRDISFLTCQIGTIFDRDVKTGAPRFHLQAYGRTWEKAIDMLRRR